MTDTIQTGKSISVLVEALKNLGIYFDILSVQGVDKVGLSFLSSNFGCKIFVGGIGVPSIYSQQRLSGVYKDSDDLFSRPFKRFENQGFQKKVTSRKDAKKIVDELLKYYFDLNKNE